MAVACANATGVRRPVGRARAAARSGCRAGSIATTAIHNGARRYYDREKPSFWQENTRILAPTLYVFVILSSAVFALRSRIRGTRRVRMSHLNLELMDIGEEAGSLTKQADLQPLRDRMVNMLRQVVVDLDHDRVSQDEFEHFSFTWRVVDTLVRDRLNTSNLIESEGMRVAEEAGDE